jgi:aldose sugar dehydrogenase
MIQRIEGGLNYGWPMLSAGPDYSGAPLGVGTEHEGMETAFHYFDETVAPSGMVFYSGDAFPEWEGDQLHGALYGESIVRVRTSDGEVDEEEWMFTGIGRVRDIQLADDGAVWIVTDAEDGQVIRISSGD